MSLSLSSCTAVFPYTTDAVMELPEDYWQDTSDLLWAFGYDAYGIFAFLTNLIL